MAPQQTRTDSSKLIACEDRARECQLANEFIGRLHVLLGSKSTLGRNASGVAANARAALSAINGLLDLGGRASFDVVGDSLFLNGKRVRPDFSNFEAFKSVVEVTRECCIRSFSFDDSVEEDDLLAFTSILASVDPDEEDPYPEIVERKQGEGIAGIELGQIEQRRAPAGKLDAGTPDPARAMEKSVAPALYFAGRCIDEGIASAGLTPRKMKRVVQLIVDGVLADEDGMLGITSLSANVGRAHRHSLNVCIYSVMLAHRLGLPKDLLREIGVAALLHDSGKVEVPSEILQKEGPLTAGERRAQEGHTPAGVAALAHFREADRTIIRAMLVAYLHHFNMDGSGYPRTGREIQPDAVSRIVRIADIYDALTAPRSSRMRPFTRKEALTAILSNAGDQIDTTLARAFAHVMNRP